MLPEANRTAFYYSLCIFNLSHITDVISPERRLAFSEEKKKGDFSKKKIHSGVNKFWKIPGDSPK